MAHPTIRLGPGTVPWWAFPSLPLALAAHLAPATAPVHGFHNNNNNKKKKKKKKL